MLASLAHLPPVDFELEQSGCLAAMAEAAHIARGRKTSKWNSGFGKISRDDKVVTKSVVSVEGWLARISHRG
jgi:hypothetical protein